MIANKRRLEEHLTKTINWNVQAKKFNLTKQQFTALSNKLEPNKNVKGANQKTRKLAWLQIGDGAGRFDKQNDYWMIYMFKSHRGFVYTTNIVDDTKNKNQTADLKQHLSGGAGSGSKAIKTIKSKFNVRTGLTFKKAFNTVEEEYKRCIPKQFYYNIINDNLFKYKKLTDRPRLDFAEASSVDFSSQYPANACGILPDAHTAKVVEGCVAPTAEYPFAFYLETGHLAIYNELDTHNGLSEEFMEYVFRTGRKETFPQFPFHKDSHTVLMQASKQVLTPEFTGCYESRKTDPLAKLVSVAAIGCLHSKKYTTNKYAHIAAVIIARSNNKMLHVLHKLNKKDVIQVCVDGLLYKGSKVFGTDEKALGLLHQEFVGCKVAYKGQNVYIVADANNNVIKSKHGAFNYYKDGITPITDDNVKSLDDIDNWIRIANEQEILQKLKGE